MLRSGNISDLVYEQKQYKVGKDVTARIGRYYPSEKGGACYQTMRGSLRRIVMKERYVEIIMENAQPKLLLSKYPESH
jgi:hypothetical protein